MQYIHKTTQAALFALRALAWLTLARATVEFLFHGLSFGHTMGGYLLAVILNWLGTDRRTSCRKGAL